MRHSCRLDNIIVEAVRSLNEPTGSYKTAIANYIEVCFHLISFSVYYDCEVPIINHHWKFLSSFAQRSAEPTFHLCIHV